MKLLLITFGVFLLAMILPKSALAVCDFHTSMTVTNKNLSNWSSTCTVTDTDGVDNPGNSDVSSTNSANITISGGAITINNGGVFRVGSINLVGGTIAIQQGGEINANAPLYVTDNDTDGWPENLTLYTSTASGRRRLGLMRSFTGSDCNDNNDFRLDNQCCVSSTYYQDADGDGYGAGTGATMCATAGYVTDNSDCYDSNANAKPGSTTCSTVNRGDGSFDYNCAGGATTCGTIYQTRAQSSVSTYAGCWYEGGSGSYYCSSLGSMTTYTFSGTTACGATNSVCTNSYAQATTCAYDRWGECGGASGYQTVCSAYTTGAQTCQ